MSFETNIKIITEAAEEAFKNKRAAKKWLTTKNLYLGNLSPIQYINSNDFHKVLSLLISIKYGFMS